MIEIFFFPFMQRALIAGIIIALLLGTLGVYIAVRKMSFIGDGIAHASLAGVALALLFGWAPLPAALIFALCIAVLLFLLEHKFRVSSDAAIGIVFTTGMALGVVLMHFYQGYQPELISYLFGNILSIGVTDLWTIAIVGIVLLLLLFLNAKKMAFFTIDPEGAYLAGLPTQGLLLGLYVMSAASIVLAIQLIGIILVSALLIFPPAMAKMTAKTFSGFQLLSAMWALFMVLFGLFFSVLLDLPSGATIVLTGAVFFGGLALLKHVMAW